MARYNERKLSYDKQNELLDSFAETLFRLKTKDAIYNFLKDLMNRKERMMFLRRFAIAERLAEGATYKQIKEELGCGESTISRVQRWLNFGRGGYIKALIVKKKKK